MRIYGPTSEKFQEGNEQVDLSFYAKKPDVLLKAGGLMNGNIDMNEHQIVNLRDPVNGQDAATMQYVNNFATYLQNNKVDYSGGTMTGILDMGDNKITGVADPENENDVVNKKYVDSVRDLDFDIIGRYLVISTSSAKNYVSIRTKKNIDLSNTYVNMTADGNEFDPQIITIDSDISILPSNTNKLGIMQLNEDLRITPTNLASPWLLLFSAKFEEPMPTNNSVLTFYDDQSTMYLIMAWSSGTFRYAITETIITKQNTTSIDIDTTQFNHIAFEYAKNKLTLWVNGKSRKSHTVDLGNLSDISIDVHQLGVVSLYNRELSKSEVAEHFVEYQVKHFANDFIKVLI